MEKKTIYLSKDKQSYFWISNVTIEDDLNHFGKVVLVKATQQSLDGLKPVQNIYAQMIISAHYEAQPEAVLILASQMADQLGNLDAAEEIHGLMSGSAAKSSGKALATGGVYAPNKTVSADPRVNSLPGINETVTHPVDGIKTTLSRVIQSLNDSHGWTRHRIADWVETLDIDIEFKDTPPKPPKHDEQLTFGKTYDMIEKYKKYYQSSVQVIPKQSYHDSTPPIDIQEYLNQVYNAHHEHVHVSFNALTNSIKAQNVKITPTTKKLIDDGVVKPVNEWYTLGHTDQLNIEYENSYEDAVPEKYKIANKSMNSGTIKINGMPVESFQIYYGGQIDKD